MQLERAYIWQSTFLQQMQLLSDKIESSKTRNIHVCQKKSYKTGYQLQKLNL